MSLIQASKKLMRKEMAAKLRGIPVELLAIESSSVTAFILSTAWYKAARTISIYLSTPHSEIQTDPLILHSLTAGKRVFIPFCPSSDPTVMRMLRLRSTEHFEGLKRNRWGIREMDPEEAARADTEDADDPKGSGLDLILVPGLAFDTKGQRLGHGRGYYDRYIRATSDYPAKFNKPPPKTVALALTSQILPEGQEVPMESWDRNPDYIVTPAGSI